MVQVTEKAEFRRLALDCLAAIVHALPALAPMLTAFLDRLSRNGKIGYRSMSVDVAGILLELPSVLRFLQSYQPKNPTEDASPHAETSENQSTAETPVSDRALTPESYLMRILVCRTNDKVGLLQCVYFSV